MRKQVIFGALGLLLLSCVGYYVLQRSVSTSTVDLYSTTQPSTLAPTPSRTTSPTPSIANDDTDTPSIANNDIDNDIFKIFAKRERDVSEAQDNNSLRDWITTRGQYMTPIAPAVLSSEQIRILEEQKGDFAIVSGCFSNNTGYVRGAMVLGYSLKYTTNTRLQTVMLATEECLTVKGLLEPFWDLIIPLRHSMGKGRDLLQKLKAFLLPFKRVIWMGADSVALRNIDHLVFCTVPCAVVDMDIMAHRMIKPVNGRLLNTKYSFYPHPAINGDFLIFEPSRDMYDRLVAYLDSKLFPEVYGQLEKIWGPHDQALLNEVVSHWTVLPFHYSIETELNNQRVWRQYWDCCHEKAYTLHFASVQKPWQNIPEATLAPARVWQGIERTMINITLPNLLDDSSRGNNAELVKLLAWLYPKH